MTWIQNLVIAIAVAVSTGTIHKPKVEIYPAGGGVHVIEATKK